LLTFAAKRFFGDMEENRWLIHHAASATDRSGQLRKQVFADALASLRRHFLAILPRLGAGCLRNYVLCHQPKSFDWRLRKARTHPLGILSNVLFVQVCDRLNQIIQVG
jgi:hypothetical protein